MAPSGETSPTTPVKLHPDGVGTKRSVGFQQEARADGHSPKAHHGHHGQHQGSAKTLVNFLKERQQAKENPLAKERYQKLLAAVVALSQQKKADVSIDREQSQNGVTLGGMLDSYGVAFEQMAQEDKVDAEAAEPEEAEEGEDGMLKIPSLPSGQSHVDLLEDECFNPYALLWGGQTNMDINLLLHCLNNPFNLVERYKLDFPNLRGWIVAIRDQYKQDNPYHNWAHALEVTHGCRSAVVSGGGTFMNFQDILALYCASIAHDVGHLGLTTPFLVSTGHDLALFYNDKSPMEMMHSYLCFKTLRDHNFLCNEKANKVKGFRQKVITAILATDIAHHFSFLDKLSTRIEKIESQPFMEDTGVVKDKDNVSKEDRWMLLEAFMHTADLIHNFKPYEVHKISLQNLEQEWFRQGDIERERGIPISPMFDRSKDSAAGCQSFFLNKMVRPLLLSFSFFVNQDYADQIVNNLDDNNSRWEEAVVKHGNIPVFKLIPILEAEDKARLEMAEAAAEVANEAAKAKQG